MRSFVRMCSKPLFEGYCYVNETSYITPNEYHEHSSFFVQFEAGKLLRRYFLFFSCSRILCHFQAVDMEGHKDDNDIDLSNDEELPPRSSTKEPKRSFTTAQVEELGQALEISQLHISLEKFQ